MPERACTEGMPETGGELQDCVVLDAGRYPVNERAYAHALRLVMKGDAVELGRDHNAICFRVGLATADGRPLAGVVKVPRMGPQRTNADTSFAWEATILASLPAAGITAGPGLLGRVAADGTHFLFMDEVPGRHPDPATHPLDAQRLCAILDHLYAMDTRGLMHYDLKPGNILIDGAQARFIDFEFARYRDFLETYTPASEAFCADYNVSINPFFPGRSNVANFEFRALHFHLRDLAAAGADADAVLRHWLHGKSGYHRQIAAFVAGLAASSATSMALAAGISPGRARDRLDAAARHEAMLADVFADPREAAARVERLLMAYRCAVFEQHGAEAAQLRRTIQAEIRPDGTGVGTLPGAYRQAVARVLELAGRCLGNP
jgi:predicted Ser/Thr protein kinase